MVATMTFSDTEIVLVHDVKFIRCIFHSIFHHIPFTESSSSARASHMFMHPSCSITQEPFYVTRLTTTQTSKLIDNHQYSIPSDLEMDMSVCDS